MSGTAALIVAAGRGLRFGGGIPKVFANLAGMPLVLWAVRAYDECEEVERLAVVVSPEQMSRAEGLLQTAGLAKPWVVVAGGERRQDSVWAGMQRLAVEPPEIVAVHDGARPLIDRPTIVSALALARTHGACVTATPVTDTIKQVDEEGRVVTTLERSCLWQAQTPQAFRFDLLLRCYERARQEGWQVTDDASVVERCGHRVQVNPASAANIKITRPEDLRHAEAMLGYAAEGWAAYRIGQGYDAHALAEGRRLVLGGVEVAHAAGLAGHSDADVVFHAICDALLGAVSAGDIGQHFPDTDPAYAGADSAVLARYVAEQVRRLGYEVENVDATVVAQRPRLASHIAAMRQNIATALGVDVSRVSVKATTTEGLGFTGREEGMAAQAVALVRRVRGAKPGGPRSAYQE